jgi:N-acyl-D-amino-acid deacylase
MGTYECFSRFAHTVNNPICRRNELMLDLLIRNALVYDGGGGKPFTADVAVNGEQIEDICVREHDAGGCDAEAARVIDANGRMLMPGFVDVHSHSDFNILADPNGESKLRQGITTEIVGQCGSSAFPLRGESLEEERRDNRRLDIDIDWETAAGYFDRLEQARPAFNVASLVGHGNVRGSVVGFGDRRPDPEEMKQMVREVREAVEAGAIGVSTGLIYAPGIFADTDEIAELQRAAGSGTSIYSSHVRSEGDALIEAADEFLEVVAKASCQGQFSHLKSSSPRNWGKVGQVIEKIEKANQQGANVHFDKYPYIASSTGLSSFLPRWARDGGRDATLERLNDPALCKSIIAESKENNEGCDGWNSVLLSSVGVPDLEQYQGKRLSEVARTIGMDPDELYLHLLRQSGLSTSICIFTMSQDETDQALLHSLGMVCTDSGCRAVSGVLRYDTPHPRSYGSFPKFFRDYVKERPLLSIEAAVEKVTLFPCRVFGFRNRGMVRKGYFADLLLVDWPRFEDCATFSDPHQYCEGIDAIVVNGTLTLLDGKQTGKRNGHVLRQGS